MRCITYYTSTLLLLSLFPYISQIVADTLYFRYRTSIYKLYGNFPISESRNSHAQMWPHWCRRVSLQAWRVSGVGCSRSRCNSFSRRTASLAFNLRATCRWPCMLDYVDYVRSAKKLGNTAQMPFKRNFGEGDHGCGTTVTDVKWFAIIAYQ